MADGECPHRHTAVARRWREDRLAPGSAKRCHPRLWRVKEEGGQRVSHVGGHTIKRFFAKLWSFRQTCFPVFMRPCGTCDAQRRDRPCLVTPSTLTCARGEILPELHPGLGEHESARDERRGKKKKPVTGPRRMITASARKGRRASVPVCWLAGRR